MDLETLTIGQAVHQSLLLTLLVALEAGQYLDVGTKVCAHLAERLTRGPSHTGVLVL